MAQPVKPGYGFKYSAYHPLTRQQLASSLQVSSPKWGEIVMGNGSFTGTVSFPDDDRALGQILVATEPDESAIYIKNALGQYVWGGVVTEQTIDEENQRIGFTCVEWRAWLFGVFLPPMENMTSDILYSWLQVDQLQIARELASYARSSGVSNGRPQMSIGFETGGKLRDLNVQGLNFKRIGELMDTIAKRDGGFEWTIEVRTHTDGLPILTFVPSYPQRGSLVKNLELYRTTAASNFDFSPIRRSSSSRVSRAWSTGSGQPPDQQWAVDSDPALATNGTLLREDQVNYPKVVDRTTLASHSRSRRAYYAPKANLFVVKTSLTDPDVNKYICGDRMPFKLRGRVSNYDLPAVRIVERTVEPLNGSGVVTLTLDLNDSVLPDVDPGGAV
jgi:hypothetical protein